MPLPNLDVPFAAAAWGWTLRSACFDKEAFLSFVNSHYAKGPELTCASGLEAEEMKDTCAPESRDTTEPL